MRAECSRFKQQHALEEAGRAALQREHATLTAELQSA
jgi:hypothetical protein